MKKFKLCILSLLLIANSGCGVLVKKIVEGTEYVNNSSVFRQGQHGELNNEETEWARTAWKYFENNYNPQTGLVNSIEGQEITNIWFIADYLAALISAHKLEIIKDYEFYNRVNSLLGFLNNMPLYKNKLPNFYYNTKSGMMVNSSNNSAEEGWSAVDIGRLLIWLKILENMYPNTSEYVDKAVLRWNFCEIIDPCGVIYSFKDKLFQENRIGYQEYIYKGFELWGFSTEKYIKSTPKEYVKIYDQLLAYDKRSIRDSENYSLINTEPFVLNGLEFNWDNLNDNNSMDSVHTDEESFKSANQIYSLQEQRFNKERVFTSKNSFYSTNKKQWIHDTIFAEGYAWNTFTESGQYIPFMKLVSLKAGIGLWTLWKTEYTNKLFETLKYAYDPQKGWFEGRLEQNTTYERTYTLTTNSMVLESLLYKKSGRIFYLSNQKDTYYDVILKDEFKRPNACFAPDRKGCQN